MRPSECRAIVVRRPRCFVVAFLFTAGGFIFSPPASADLIISSTFDSSITGDANGAAIQSVINTATAFYQTRFADPITVHIYFKEMTMGLGQTEFGLYQTTYASFRTQLNSDKKTADDNTALAHLPSGPNNPVTNNANINGKPANLRALGYDAPPLTLFGGIKYDGVISLNTHLTDVGSPGTTSEFSLLAVVEHEIDEVLGLGSTLGLGGLPAGFASAPSPEDLYRYDSTGVAHARSFTTAGDDAFFSIDGTNNLVQFNQLSNGDYGDWWSNTAPGANRPARVQDAFAYAGSSPSLNAASIEMRALDVIGYDFVAVPELAAPVGLIFVALGCLVFNGAKKWINDRRPAVR